MSHYISNLQKAIANLPRNAGPDLHMEDLLIPTLLALPELMQDRSSWKSLYINYEPPYLLRLYRPFTVDTGNPAELRTIYISQHYFFGQPGTGASDQAGLHNPYLDTPEFLNKQSANNYHPHPWAAAFLLLDGSYFQDIGRATSLGYSADPAFQPVPHDTWEQDARNPLKNWYAFNDPLTWHRVLPNDGLAVSSIMLTYIPENWRQVGPKPPTPQRSLNLAESEFMFDHFSSLYRLKTPIIMSHLQQFAPRPSRLIT